MIWRFFSLRCGAIIRYATICLSWCAIIDCQTVMFFSTALLLERIHSISKCKNTHFFPHYNIFLQLVGTAILMLSQGTSDDLQGLLHSFPNVEYLYSTVYTISSVFIFFRANRVYKTYKVHRPYLLLFLYCSLALVISSRMPPCSTNCCFCRSISRISMVSV